MSAQIRGYLARKYHTRSYGGKSYYEEGIFGSYDKAYEFIRMISDETSEGFLSEILSFVVDDIEPWENEQVWKFDNKGNLIHVSDAKTKYADCIVVEENGGKIIYSDPKPESYTKLFTIGDIVLVKPYPWNAESPVHKDTIGVVTSTPTVFEAWISSGGDRYEWDNTYVIHYIAHGYLDHVHMPEHGIAAFTGNMPESISFLKMLSDHFKGYVRIKDAILKQIFAGEIFVEIVEHIDKNLSITE
ncbi:MAG: hypothetical protein AAGU11_02055 [Syntrophobacteraceae bacterium]